MSKRVQVSEQELAAALAHPTTLSAVNAYRVIQRAVELQRAVEQNAWLDDMARDADHKQIDPFLNYVASVEAGDTKKIADCRAQAASALAMLHKALKEHAAPIKGRGRPVNSDLFLLIARLSTVWREVTGRQPKVGHKQDDLLPDGSRPLHYTGAVLDFACTAVASLPDSVRPSRESLYYAFRTLPKFLGFV
ncbi:hypothetical protein CF68_06925 [Cupriavidus sp. SK-4]|uniref:hypothetical protein n=1 Tax=Cupriavidus sp. SK-4 TaxID=574750 RepID=UPI00044C371D|nr:hypothetical protein [Cupriavidus sp. SK-4]EYS86211.1 hypothetical protein CF68_06925 [Cupriavidus sp. SK-4]